MYNICFVFQGGHLKLAEALVIVESPAKAKTIGKYLGSKYIVKASVGHIRDLPKSKLGIDIDDGYTPGYITVRGKGSIIKELKLAAKKVKKIYFAADHDREGEAIAWHLAYILQVDADSNCRVVFNEITKQAIKDAFKEPRKINVDLVNAQQTRRILDRLVGYGISPLLWKKVKSGLSAGRVQSIAVKLIIDREQEITNFQPEEYWSVLVTLLADKQSFQASFYGYGTKKAELKSAEEVEELLARIKGKKFAVEKIKESERKRQPSPPFITSTLQQEASRKLGFRVQKTMRIAQQLYEGVSLDKKDTVGLITYMRTDSLRISPVAQAEAKEYIIGKYGQKYYPDKTRFYKQKKSSQDAHEAIRPSSVFNDPERVKPFLSRDQYRLYSLIWQRFVASQMASALFDQLSVDIRAGEALFRATGSKLQFAGFIKVYNIDEEPKNKKAKSEATENQLPMLTEGQLLKKKAIDPKQHFTQPPPRYNEARLIKELEDKGIGRPSTYAPTLDTVQRRGYVLMEDKQFIPSELGQIVLKLITEFFPDIINLKFTAEMEENLDLVEEGQKSWVNTLDEFYPNFRKQLQVAEEQMEKIVIKDEPSDESCEKCGHIMVYKHGRYGKFLACGAFPACRNTKTIVKSMGVSCPSCKTGELVERKTKKKRTFYGCNRYPECDFMLWDKPMAQPCPKCGQVMVQKKNKKERKQACTSCKYEVTNNE